MHEPDQFAPSDPDGQRIRLVGALNLRRRSHRRALLALVVVVLLVAGVPTALALLTG